jgi:hypothetical protein
MALREDRAESTEHWCDAGATNAITHEWVGFAGRNLTLGLDVSASFSDHSPTHGRGRRCVVAAGIDTNHGEQSRAWR